MKLKLPDVTLVCVETREHELARRAIFDCVRVAEFAEVLVLTDKPELFPDFYRIHKVPDWPEKIGWSRSWWYDVPPLLRTKQTLNIQWDSWICDPSMWSDEFLQYDYIGAPWWYDDGKNVGNGGFSLVSTALKRYLAKHRDRFPCNTAIDDDLLCRKYRPQLEREGFVWAPEAVADRFSFEGCGVVGQPPRPFRQHFGFHGMFNWPKVLDEERLMDRLRIASQSEYIFHPDSYMAKGFCSVNPEIAKKLRDILAKDAEHQSEGVG